MTCIVRTIISMNFIHCVPRPLIRAHITNSFVSPVLKLLNNTPGPLFVNHSRLTQYSFPFVTNAPSTGIQNVNYEMRRDRGGRARTRMRRIMRNRRREFIEKQLVNKLGPNATTDQSKPLKRHYKKAESSTKK